MDKRLKLALVLIGACVIMYFLMGPGGLLFDPERPARSTASIDPSGPGPGSAGAPRPRDRSSRPGGPAEAEADVGTRTYVTDTGNPVRDHRRGVTEPVALPAPMPPSERTMNSVVTAAIYQQLAPIVRGCGLDLPPDARGDDPIVHVTLMVDVAGEQLTTSEATAVTSDVKGATADEVVACVRDRASALTVAAKGEPDRSGYVVQYPFRLRK